MEWYEKKRGRPKGSKTKETTPGKKRAREFIEFRLDNELKPTKAAEAIGAKHGVETCQIFKDEKRHRESICRDLWAEADQARRNYEDMLAAQIGPKRPNDVRSLLCAFVNALKGQSI